MNLIVVLLNCFLFNMGYFLALCLGFRSLRYVCFYDLIPIYAPNIECRIVETPQRIGVSLLESGCYCCCILEQFVGPLSSLEGSLDCPLLSVSVSSGSLTRARRVRATAKNISGCYQKDVRLLLERYQGAAKQDARALPKNMSGQCQKDGSQKDGSCQGEAMRC